MTQFRVWQFGNRYLSIAIAIDTLERKIWTCNYYCMANKECKAYFSHYISTFSTLSRRRGLNPLYIILQIRQSHSNFARVMANSLQIVSYQYNNIDGGLKRHNFFKLIYPESDSEYSEYHDQKTETASLAINKHRGFWCPIWGKIMTGNGKRVAGNGKMMADNT